MSTPASVLEAAAAYRSRIHQADDAVLREISGDYSVTARRLERDFQTVTRMIAEARIAGTPVSPGWLLRQKRYQLLLGRVADELDAFASRTSSTITRSIATAARTGADDARRLVVDNPVDAMAWSNLPAGAVETLAGTISGPVGLLLRQASEDGARAARQALLRGVALGWNPRRTAIDVRKSLGITGTRALLISRTETMRAYREANRSAWQQNPVLVREWEWLSARDQRCCAVCWAMSGTRHPLDEVMGTHVGCRCTMLPVSASFASLGIDAPETGQPPASNGPAEFATLPPAQQDRVLGRQKGAAYREGRFALPDVVKTYDHRLWGPGRREKNLTELLGGRRRRPAMQPTAAAPPTPPPVLDAPTTETLVQGAERGLIGPDTVAERAPRPKRRRT